VGGAGGDGQGRPHSAWSCPTHAPCCSSASSSGSSFRAFRRILTPPRLLPRQIRCCFGMLVAALAVNLAVSVPSDSGQVGPQPSQPHGVTTCPVSCRRRCLICGPKSPPQPCPALPSLLPPRTTVIRVALRSPLCPRNLFAATSRTETAAMRRWWVSARLPLCPLKPLTTPCSMVYCALGV